MPPFPPRPPQQSPFFYGPMMRPYPTNRVPLSPQRMGGRGGRGLGLLGRLLNRQGQSGIPFTGFERQGVTRAGASTAQQLANPMNFQQMLSNTQQVLQTMQQMGPIIEQYGPFVKNLPAMWKLYRGLKSLPDAEAENVETAKEVNTEEIENKEVVTPEDEEIQTSEQPKDRTSKPKLYI
ncbi:hypothetical protein CD798_15760 [Bacillaceae bacterium SAOS 7]|nr:hypothetical protein CD798_15760 [Bacillaceae bacterium SAOS 7]